MSDNIILYKNEDKINSLKNQINTQFKKEVFSWIIHKNTRIIYFNVFGLKGKDLITLLKIGMEINSLLETGEKKRTLYNLHMVAFTTSTIPYLKAYQDSSEHVFHKSALINIRSVYRLFLKVFEGMDRNRLDPSICYPESMDEALDWLAEDTNFYEPTKFKKF